MYPPLAVAHVEEKMADFCKACSIDNFGRDYGDLRGLGPKCDEGYGYPVICEGCGFILVDHLGNCFKCDLMKGKRGHDGQNLKPLEGGRYWWRLYDFGNRDDSEIELGAPL
jgi:hypothetical protein